jgi:predicted nucleic acid-binding protein
MFLIDTNVISEIRRRERANSGVQKFFLDAARSNTPLYLAAVTIGELRRGIDLIRHRGDLRQADVLERWMDSLLMEYKNSILDFNREIAQVWGRMRVPNHESALDKQIAATAYFHGLSVVTRNEKDFKDSGVRIINPFSPD